MGLSHISIHIHTPGKDPMAGEGVVVSNVAKWKAFEVSQWDANLLQQGPWDTGRPERSERWKECKGEKERGEGEKEDVGVGTRAEA